MITLNFVFYMFIILFAIIGAIRGWAKELLVGFSIILALFIISVLETYVDFVMVFITNGGPGTEFWFRTLIILGLAFFGYQTPNLPRFREAARRERLQDSLLGIVLGGLNGALIFGSIWAYLHNAQYPFEAVTAPIDPAALSLLALMPPMWLGIPAIYFVVAVAFTFVVIVFV